MFEGAWTTWTEVPQEIRDLMWVQFQLRYQWDPKDEAQVKANWNDILAVRFRDVIRDARDKAIKLAGENGVIVRDDWSVLKPYHPEWIDEGNWCTMIDKVWNTEKWKLKSAKGKANRATTVEGKMAGHSGGSRSMIHTQVYMEKEKGGPVSFVEVYETYFTKKASKLSSGSREFTDPKAERVRNEYHQLLEEEFGLNAADHPTQIVPTLWEKACGGMKKGKLFGATRDMLVMVEGSCSRRVGPSNEEVETLKDEVKRQKLEVEDTKKQAEIAERKAKVLKTQVAEMQDREKIRELEMIGL